jgi:hypothetical protein
VKNIQEIIEQLQDAVGSVRNLKIIYDTSDTKNNVCLLKAGAIFLPANEAYPFSPIPFDMPMCMDECKKRQISVIVVIGWAYDLKKIMRISSENIDSISLI